MTTWRGFHDSDFYEGILYATAALQNRARVYFDSARRILESDDSAVHDIGRDHETRARWYYEAARELHHGGGT